MSPIEWWLASSAIASLAGVAVYAALSHTRDHCRHCGARLHLRVRRSMSGGWVRFCAACGGYHGEVA